MSRERSEDALTWNVFRYLERGEVLGRFVHFLTGRLSECPNLIYIFHTRTA